MQVVEHIGRLAIGGVVPVAAKCAVITPDHSCYNPSPPPLALALLSSPLCMYTLGNINASLIKDTVSICEGWLSTSFALISLF